MLIVRYGYTRVISWGLLLGKVKWVWMGEVLMSHSEGYLVPRRITAGESTLAYVGAVRERVWAGVLKGR